MNIMKKAVTVLIILMCFFCFSACKEKINSASDEMRMHGWRLTGEYGLEAEIRFYDENAALTVTNHDESCVIDGLCIITDDALVIIDNELHKEYSFEYTLSGTSLTLITDGETAVFEKVSDN